LKTLLSRENREYKRWKSLLLHRGRSREKAYLAEGSNLARDAVSSGRSVRSLIFREGAEPKEVLDEKTLEAASARGTRMYGLAESLFETLTPAERGVDVISEVEIEDFTTEDLKGRGRGAGALNSVLVLDRLQDPGNVGTVIRTADAAGFAGIVVIKGTADIYSPKVVRSAAGSVFRMPMVQAEDAGEAVSICRGLGLPLVATGFDTDKLYCDADLSPGVALVIGNEGRGISRELMSAADITVKIPMFGEIDSLNASSAAAVVMYECVRQNMNRSKNVK
jgi:TrmH family RNA methyltransferase